MTLTFHTDLEYYKPKIQFCLPPIGKNNIIPVPRKGERVRVLGDVEEGHEPFLTVLDVTHDYRFMTIRIKLG